MSDFIVKHFTTFATGVIVGFTGTKIAGEFVSWRKSKKASAGGAS